MHHRDILKSKVPNAMFPLKLVFSYSSYPPNDTLCKPLSTLTF